MKRLLAIFVALALLSPSVVSANDRLWVEFQSTPLFTEVNLVPGHESIRHFTVKNTSGTEQEIGLGLINVSGGGLESALDARIFSEGVEYFSGTLSGLFQMPQVSLGQLSSGNERKYHMSITFRPTAGNEQQKQTTGFDLCVGFVGVGEGCVPDTGNGGAGSGSGGGTQSSSATPDNGSELAVDPIETLDIDPLEVPDELLDLEGEIAGASDSVGNSSSKKTTGGEPQVERGERRELADNQIESRRPAQTATALLGFSGDSVGGMKCLFVLIAILIMVWLLTFAYDAVRRAHELSKESRVLDRVAFVASLFAVATLIAVLVPFTCLILTLYLLTWLSVGWYVVERVRLRRDR